MRIWDIDAGFLNNQSLLGEHRELHGIVSIIQNNKKGYSRHPETLRWQRCLQSLTVRHNLLVEEMLLRGLKHQSPVLTDAKALVWPTIFIDEPFIQFDILRIKYQDKKPGRIPLPQNAIQLWSFHKYSVMAREPDLYRKFGPRISNNQIPFETLSKDLVMILRTPPRKERIINAIDHMWGYVSEFSSLHRKDCDADLIFKEIQHLAQTLKISYLIRSTALAELSFWYHYVNKKEDPSYDMQLR